MEPISIAIIGSGNLAFHLIKALDLHGYAIRQVISRNAGTGKELADAWGAGFAFSPADLDPEADMVFLCVPDDQISLVAKEIRHYKGLVVHTSGSISLQPLQEIFTTCGVFYPLQSFSRKRPIDFQQIPLCIEGSDANSLRELMLLGNKLSKKVLSLSSEKRLTVHAAAVLVNNFSNLLFVQAHTLLKEQQIPFDLLKPLILETALKVQEILPEEAQTGPAKRRDQTTLDKHLQLLQNHSDLAQLYKMMSKMIGEQLTT